MTPGSPDDATLRALLAPVRHIAVVGLSPKPDRPSHAVAREMLERGYEIVPVRPGVTEVLGRKAYRDLDELPLQPDLVDVFVNAARIGPLVDACIRRGVAILWLQEGIVNAAEAARARASGITVVMDRCLLKECRRLDLRAPG